MRVSFTTAPGQQLSHVNQMLGDDGPLALGAYLSAVLVLTVLAAIAVGALLVRRWVRRPRP